MKKIIFLLLLIVITGCTIKEVDNNYDNIINNTLSKSNVPNTISRGYKYYLPNGVKLVENSESNEILIYGNNHYYLYVDIIGYFYNIKDDYNEKEDVYFSRKININDKNGFIEVSETDNMYYIESYYNYASIEAFVNKNDLEQNMINILNILNSIKFNKYIEEFLLGKDNQKFAEEKYEEYKSKRTSGSFLEFSKELEKYIEEKYKEEIEINIGNEE